LLPTLWNMHTHLGDAFLYEAPKPGGLQAMVGPRGFKHTRLASASKHEIVDAARRRIAAMVNLGTLRFFDFREGGHYGVGLLREALVGTGAKSVVLGRPAGEWAEVDEMDELVAEADGVGIPSIVDMDMDLARRLSDAARKRGKLVAIHVSEGSHEDLAAALDLKPHFVVHMVHGTKDDFATLAQAKVPVVVCPRSNERFGLQPPLDLMAKAGVTVLVGSDNAMLTDGDLFAELALMRRWWPGLRDEELLAMITTAPRRSFPKMAEASNGGWPGTGLVLAAVGKDGRLDLSQKPRLLAR
jgi:cytosine/adenosine deaminase-related metal-dependent hydrolase